MNIRIGLIGAGRMGQVFAHHLAYSVAEADFVRCIVEDIEPSATGKDGWAATAIGIAATLSLDEGRPVYLSELQ